MMEIAYSLVAIFIAWIWVIYFRSIDLFEPEKWRYLIMAFLLGATSVLVVFGLHALNLPVLDLRLTGSFIDDWLFATVRVGMVEEFAKTLAFVVFFLLFKREVNEPIDFLVFACIGALGFSAVENVLYFNNYGPEVINGRSVLATIGHMFDTGVVVYGFVLFRYHSRKWYWMPLTFILGSMAHGFYDFWLMYQGAKGWGWIVTILFFLVGISLFSTILNNALNQSHFFTRKKVINSEALGLRMFQYYGILFAITFALLVLEYDWKQAVASLDLFVVLVVFIAFIVCTRLSRFRLIPGRWEPIRFAFPLRFRFSGEVNQKRLTLAIGGAGFNLAPVQKLVGKELVFEMFSGVFRRERKAFQAQLFQKFFLSNDQAIFRIEVSNFDMGNPSRPYFFIPKRSGLVLVGGSYPLGYIGQLKGSMILEDFKFSKSDFEVFGMGSIKNLKRT